MTTRIDSEISAWPHPLLPNENFENIVDPLAAAVFAALYPAIREVKGPGHFVVDSHVLQFAPSHSTVASLMRDVCKTTGIPDVSKKVEQLATSLARSWQGHSEKEIAYISAAIRMLATYQINNPAIRKLLPKTVDGLREYAKDRYPEKRGGGALLQFTAEVVTEVLRGAKQVPPQYAVPFHNAADTITVQQARVKGLYEQAKVVLDKQVASDIAGLLAQLEAQQDILQRPRKNIGVILEDGNKFMQLDCLLIYFMILPVRPTTTFIKFGTEKRIGFTENRPDPKDLVELAVVLKEALTVSRFTEFDLLMMKAIRGIVQYLKKFDETTPEALSLSYVAYEIARVFNISLDFIPIEPQPKKEERAKRLATLWNDQRLTDVVNRVEKVLNGRLQVPKADNSIFIGLETQLTFAQNEFHSILEDSAREFAEETEKVSEVSVVPAEAPLKAEAPVVPEEKSTLPDAPEVDLPLPAEVTPPEVATAGRGPKNRRR